MAFRIKANRWVYASLSIFSLCLAFTITPVTASPPVQPAVVSVSQPTSQLEQGRNLYQAGRFAEAVTIWQSAAQQYRIQGDRNNEALSLSYLSIAQQELNQWPAARQSLEQSMLNQWPAARQSLEQSMKLLSTAQPAADAIIWAQILNTKANLELRTGQAEVALKNWQQAQKYYEQAGDTMGSLGSQINQAQALQRLGFYRRSKQQLEILTQKLRNLPDSEIKVSGLRSLGLALHAIGDQQSQQVLAQSLTTAEKIDAKTHLSSILSSLGKVASDFQDPETALNYFEDAQTAATNPNEALQARLAQFKLLVDYDKIEYAISLAPQLQQQLLELPPSHNSLYGAINFVATLNRLKNPEQVIPRQDVAQLMAATVKSAQQIQDQAAQAYALYQWGQLYRQTNQWSEARELTQQSLNIARQLQAEDIIAQSAWQVGKLYKQQGKRPEAIAAYTEAVQSLKALRGDMVAVNPDVQFSFRESVEPVYRELVSLLLDEQPTQTALMQARELIESLQIAELDNFFREACLDKVQQIDRVDPKATVIYPIILSDRLAVILSQAGQPLRYYVTPKPQAEIEQTLDQFLVALNPVSDTQDRMRLSQQIYDWLIRPAEQVVPTNL